QSMNVYAYCFYNSGGTTSQVFGKINAPAGGIGHATVSCPAGSVVTGGGYASSDVFNVYNSSKDGNGWQVWAENHAGTSKQLNAYAICLSGTGATSSSVLISGSIPANSTKQVSSECPSGSFLTGGGFAANPDLLIYNVSMTLGSPHTWRTFVRNSTGSDLTLFNYAICLTYP
ncbi:hypothetical protein ACFLXB_05995, partial [Chloroflexota bacterium]